MALRVPISDARELGLPGRRSREILSGLNGADSTLRLVEIAVPQPGDRPRPPHWHPDSEECIHVISGKGVTWVDGADFPMQPGDTIRIAPGEHHVSRNTGETALVLLCYFPVPVISFMTEPERSDDA